MGNNGSLMVTSNRIMRTQRRKASHPMERRYREDIADIVQEFRGGLNIALYARLETNNGLPLMIMTGECARLTCLTLDCKCV